MTHRAGVTLIEVLVSIFIMGVGLLALLTLFPLGALTMAQAIKDDRCAQAAANAEAIVVYRDLRNNSTITTLFQTPGSPWIGLRTVPGALEGPSYPVYVDPFGVLGSGTTTAVGPPLGQVRTGTTVQSAGIPRRNILAVGRPLATALQWFSLQDDMEFTADGLPKRIGTEIQRDPQYTWAYLFRRPDASVTNVVDVSIVVYSGRPLQLPPAEATYWPITFDTNSNDVVVTWDPATQQRPALRKGGWILDATVQTGPAPGGRPSPHGFFYRVASVTDLPASAGRPGVVLSLQTRPKKGTTQGVLVVMEHVAEVFEKGGDWKP